jgi:pimeloyl-ACP methyl ester carboxylesterase
MRFRASKTETKAFFASAGVSYLDKTATIDNHKLHYIETGNENNPTLFFIHGSPGSWDAYKKYLKDNLLLQKYRMVAIDRPGFGYSNFGQAENLPMQAVLISKLIQSIDNKKPVTLIGHSMGGPVAVKLATLYPNGFENIVILAGSVDPQAETEEKWRPVIKARPLRYLIPGALRPSNDELWWLKHDLVVMQRDLKKIKCKVIIIHGTKDQLVPFSNVPFMEKESVNAKSIDVLAIEGANHFIPWEHFDVIRDRLLAL